MTGDRGRQLPAVAWLTLVWLLLWGSFSLLSVVGGVLVAVVVTALFRLPAPADRLPFRPWRLLALAGFLLYDLVVSASGVSWQVLRHGPGARGAIVAVPLLSASDRVVPAVALAFTLSPGTMTLQTDHEQRIWYVYALGPRDRAGVERARRQAMDIQRRVLAALGSPAEIAEAQRRAAS